MLSWPQLAYYEKLLFHDLAKTTVVYVNDITNGMDKNPFLALLYDNKKTYMDTFSNNDSFHLTFE